MGGFLSRKRMKFLLVAFLIGAASSFKISSKEDLIKRFGEKNVSFNPNVRTNYCNQCMEITVTSSGGTQEHQKQTGQVQGGRVSLGEHGPFLDGRQQAVHHPRPQLQPNPLLHEVGDL